MAVFLGLPSMPMSALRSNRRAGRNPSAGAELLGVLRTNLTQNPIVNPVLVPPLFRIDLNSRNHHAEMHVIAKSHSGSSANSDLLLLPDHISDFD